MTTRCEMTDTASDRPMCGSRIVYTVDGVPQDPLRCSLDDDGHPTHLAYSVWGSPVSWPRPHMESRP